MIARMWHGVTTPDKADEFLENINQTGVPGLKGITGNQGVYVLRRTEETEVHFIMISLWDSREAIVQFAGETSKRPGTFPKIRTSCWSWSRWSRIMKLWLDHRY